MGATRSRLLGSYLITCCHQPRVALNTTLVLSLVLPPLSPSLAIRPLGDRMPCLSKYNHGMHVRMPRCSQLPSSYQLAVSNGWGPYFDGVLTSQLLHLCSSLYFGSRLRPLMLGNLFGIPLSHIPGLAISALLLVRKHRWGGAWTEVFKVTWIVQRRKGVATL